MRVSPGAGWRGTLTTRSMFTLPTTVMMGASAPGAAPGSAPGSSSGSFSATLLPLLFLVDTATAATLRVALLSLVRRRRRGAALDQLYGHDHMAGGAAGILDPLEQQPHRCGRQ